MGADPPRQAGPAGHGPAGTAPLIHGSAQWGTLPACSRGDTVVFVPQFDPHDVWRAVQRHKVNVIMIIGDAMARPLIEAYQQEEYDVSSVLAIFSNARAVLAERQGAVPRVCCRTS